MVRFESENPWLDCAGSKTEDTPVMQQRPGKQQDDLVHVEKNIRARLVEREIMLFIGKPKGRSRMIYSFRLITDLCSRDLCTHPHVKLDRSEALALAHMLT